HAEPHALRPPVAVAENGVHQQVARFAGHEPAVVSEKRCAEHETRSASRSRFSSERLQSAQAPRWKLPGPSGSLTVSTEIQGAMANPPATLSRSASSSSSASLAICLSGVFWVLPLRVTFLLDMSGSYAR